MLRETEREERLNEKPMGLTLAALKQSRQAGIGDGRRFVAHVIMHETHGMATPNARAAYLRGLVDGVRTAVEVEAEDEIHAPERLTPEEVRALAKLLDIDDRRLRLALGSAGILPPAPTPV